MNDTTLPSANDEMVYVPLDSISIGGVAPEIGDEVEFAITARVDSIEGDQACVVPVTVNGQEVESGAEDAGEPQEEPLDQMHDRLRGMIHEDNSAY